jgi:hypothetical protein
MGDIGAEGRGSAYYDQWPKRGQTTREATTMAITNDQDVINSLDVIERIAELEAIEANAAEFGGEEFSDEERAERIALRALAAQAGDCAEDWECGTAIIRDSYFVEYAQELHDDIGAVSYGNPDEPITNVWPYTCIDWEWAARELQYDYTAVDFDGVTYWVR